MTRRAPNAATVAFGALLLAACGGGDGGSNGGGGGGLPPPGPPLVEVSGPSPFADGCSALNGGTNYRNAEVEPHLAVDPTDPNRLLAAWQQDRFSNGGARGLVTAHSNDGGLTWTRRTLPASRCGGGTLPLGTGFDRATDPWVAFGADGRAYAVALAFEAEGNAAIDNAIIVFRSFDGGATWGAPTHLITDDAANFNDKEAMAADPVDPAYAYASWDRLTADNRGPAMFTRTTDGGATWEAARVAYDPGAGHQTINVVPVVAPDGTLHLFLTRILRGASPAVELMVMRSTDRGASFGAPVRIADNFGVGARDPQTGEPVRDGAGVIFSAAVGPSGELLVAWQDSRFAVPGSHDTVVVSTSTDGGATWSAPAAITDPAVSAFTPTAAFRADGRVGITYFDFRDDVAADARLDTSYWLTTSADLVGWTEARVSQRFNLRLAPDAGGLFLGDYMGLVTSGGWFVPLFVQTNNDGTDDRNGVYAMPVGQLTAVRAASAAAAKPATARAPDAALRALTYQAAMRALAARVPDWEARQARFEAAARARDAAR